MFYRCQANANQLQLARAREIPSIFGQLAHNLFYGSYSFTAKWFTGVKELYPSRPCRNSQFLVSFQRIFLNCQVIRKLLKEILSRRYEALEQIQQA